MTTLIHNARKLDEDGVIHQFWVRLKGDRIFSTGTGAPSPLDEDFVVDAEESWLTPGFIDLHCHGGGGHSFGADGREITRALRRHRRAGTTRSVISLVSGSIESLSESLGAVSALMKDDATILGSHLEGPFLSKTQCGAHNLEYLSVPTEAKLETLLNAARGTLVQVTLAPELSGGLEAIKRLVEEKIRVAVGHTNATYLEAKKAFDLGASLLTHAFNAMRPIHHREPGPLIAAFEDPRVTLELVLDGQHVGIPAASLAFREAPGRIALVTDAMAAAGSGDGNYALGGSEVSVTQGQATIKGTNTIAGSTVTQDEVLRFAILQLGLPPIEAVQALTSTPARSIGTQTEMGYLRPGYVGDLVLLDESWRVKQVWAAGVPLP